MRLLQFGRNCRYSLAGQKPIHRPFVSKDHVEQAKPVKIAWDRYSYSGYDCSCKSRKADETQTVGGLPCYIQLVVDFVAVFVLQKTKRPGNRERDSKTDSLDDLRR